MKVDQEEIPSVFEKVFHDDYLVEKIVKNIPLKQRWNLAATDRRLYSIICELDAKKHIIQLSPAHLDDASIIASIINSKRKFDRIRLRNFENKHLDILKKIAEKHGQTIKELHCCWILENDLPHMEAFEAKKLEAFFEKLPNLVDLDVHQSGRRVFIFRNMIGECTPVLKSLKKFTFYESFYLMRIRGVEITDATSSFRNFSALIASDTVEEFKYDEFNAECRDFIKRQAKIKTIEVSGLNNAKALKHLKLENILIIPSGEGSDAFLQQIFRHHKKTLKELNTLSHTMSEDTIGVLCERLQVLEHLSINLTNENVQSFIAVDRLKALKSLNIDFTENEFDRFDLLLELTRVKLPCLKKLSITVVTNNNQHDFDAIVRNIGENWENLEKLVVDRVFEMLNGGKTSINSILENVRKLKKLRYDLDDDRENFHTVFKYNGQTYPLIEEFTTGFFRDVSFITALNIFPNLRKLSIDCAYRGPSQLKGFVALKKLKDLNICLVVESSLVTPSQEEISLFKQLCRQTGKFRINIECPLDSDFCNVLAAALTDHVVSVFEDGNERTLTLKSKKY